MSARSTQFIDLSARTAAAQQTDVPRVELAARAGLPQALFDGSAGALRLYKLSRPVPIDNESARWFAFVDALKAGVVSGSASAVQRSTLLSIWERALARQPSLRRPAVGVSTDGLLQASWSFVDTPGRVFTLDIQGNGAIDWFYRDETTETSRGAGDDFPHELPAEAFDLLTLGFGTTAPGRR